MIVEELLGPETWVYRTSYTIYHE